MLCGSPPILRIAPIQAFLESFETDDFLIERLSDLLFEFSFDPDVLARAHPGHLSVLGHAHCQVAREQGHVELVFDQFRE
jgi:hypothetical protein